MLDILPSYYIVFLALGLAAIVVVLFYSFTRNSNYEVQQRAKKIQLKREKENQGK
jgi:phosphotransferase system  glucose/maltose/N-acetylglucosamine-specific IIC component